MRFNLRIALAATAYVALAAAALSQTHAIWASVLWAVTMLACCYAALVCCAWDDRRRYALGFVIASGVSLANLWMFPSSTVPRQMLVAMGLSTRSEGPPLPISGNYDLPEVVADPFTPRPALANSPVTIRMVTRQAPATSRIQAANAVGTMVAGLVGCGLGALAYRRVQREAGK